MPDALLYPPGQNAVQRELGAQLLDSAGNGDTLTLDSSTGMQNKPGVCVINRINANEVETPDSREYIEYSAISGTSVTIKTRNVDGSGAVRTHAVGSVVEFIPDVTWAERINTALSLIVDASDVSTLKTTIVTTTGTQTLTNKTVSGATLSGTTNIVARQSQIYDNGNSGANATLSFANGDTQKITLTADANIYWADPAEGDYMTLHVIQDASTGGHNPTFPSGANYPGGVAPTWSATPSARDVVAIRPYSSTEIDILASALDMQ